MTIEDIKKIQNFLHNLIETLDAAIAGKQIQMVDTNNEWRNIDLLDDVAEFNVDHTWRLRVKPEPEFRPYDSKEEIEAAVASHGSWIKRKEDIGTSFNILNTSIAGVHIFILGKYSNIGFIDLVENYVFVKDNAPCGIRIKKN